MTDSPAYCPSCGTSPLANHQGNCDYQRAVLAEIREKYRLAPIEDVDDSNVIGFGQRGSTDQQRPPRKSP